MNEAAGTIFVSYPASEEVPQWVLRRVFARNLDWLLKQVEEEEFLSRTRAERTGPAPLCRGPGLPPPSRRTLARGGGRPAAAGLRRALLPPAGPGPGPIPADGSPAWHPVPANQRAHQTPSRVSPLRAHRSPGPGPSGDLADMASNRRMNRLLQGDVGSGKTVVALFAMLLAVEGGYQAVLMAPTEILAEQHARKLGGDGGTSGRGGASPDREAWPPADRREALRDPLGQARILAVGTHALIQEACRVPGAGSGGGGRAAPVRGPAAHGPGGDRTVGPTSWSCPPRPFPDPWPWPSTATWT